jgi:transposase InsO family protein
MPLDEVDDSIDQADPRDPLLYKPDPELLPNAESFAPLSATQASALAAIHSKRSNVFNDRVDDPALFDPFDVEIDPAKAHLLIPHEPRRVSPAMRSIAVEQHAQKISEGIFVRPRAPVRMTSPVVYVKQKDKTRECGDYSRVNSASLKLSFPIPDVYDTVRRAARFKYYFRLDVTQCYHQCMLTKRASSLLALTTVDGVLLPLRAQFGPSNLPAHMAVQFRRILSALPEYDSSSTSSAVFSFFDDILGGANSIDDLLELYDRTLQILLASKVKLRFDKCSFGATSLKFLGLIISAGGIALDSDRISSLTNLAPATTVEGVQHILGCFNFVRDFCPALFAITAKPLYSLAATGKGRTKVDWGPQHDFALSELKKMVEGSILITPDPKRRLHVRTDASRLGIGCVLFQYSDTGTPQAICYAGKAFDSTQRDYSTVEQEAYAVVYACERFKDFTQGHPFTLETDSRTLTFIANSSVPKLVRYRLHLQEHQYSLRHVRGILNSLCDGISRSWSCAKSALPHPKTPPPVTNNSSLPTPPTAPKPSRDRILFPLVSPTPLPPSAAPNPSLADIVKDFHSHSHKGVVGSLRELRSACALFPFSEVHAAVTKVCHECATCQRVRSAMKKSCIPRGVLTGSPFYELSVDSLGPFPPDNERNIYLIVIIDSFSRFIWLAPSPSNTAIDAARALLSVFGIVGCPAQIRSDNGPCYAAAIMTEFLRLASIHHHKVTPYNPKQNSIVERSNRQILHHARSLVFDDTLGPDSALRWSDLCPSIMRIINTSYHSSLGVSPAKIVFGDSCDHSRQILTPREPTSTSQWLSDLDNAQASLLQASKKFLDDRHSLMISNDLAKRAKNGLSATTFEHGSFVLREDPHPAHKLVPRYQGPFLVISKDGSSPSIECKCLTSDAIFVFPASSLHPFTFASALDADTQLSQGKLLAAKPSFLVESILDHEPKGPRNGRPRKAYKFLTKWLGYPDSENSWNDFTDFPPNHHILNSYCRDITELKW